jgi:hypothetical protein
MSAVNTSPVPGRASGIDQRVYLPGSGGGRFLPAVLVDVLCAVAIARRHCLERAVRPAPHPRQESARPRLGARPTETPPSRPSIEPCARLAHQPRSNQLSFCVFAPFAVAFAGRCIVTAMTLSCHPFVNGVKVPGRLLSVAFSQSRAKLRSSRPVRAAAVRRGVRPSVAAPGLSHAVVRVVRTRRRVRGPTASVDTPAIRVFGRDVTENREPGRWVCAGRAGLRPGARGNGVVS